MLLLIGRRMFEPSGEISVTAVQSLLEPPWSVFQSIFLPDNKNLQYRCGLMYTCRSAWCSAHLLGRFWIPRLDAKKETSGTGH